MVKFVCTAQLEQEGKAGIQRGVPVVVEERNGTRQYPGFHSSPVDPMYTVGFRSFVLLCTFCSRTWLSTFCFSSQSLDHFAGELLSLMMPDEASEASLVSVIPAGAS